MKCHGEIDNRKINIKQVPKWAKKFGITRAHLRKAMNVAGPWVADVKARLIEKIEDV